MKKIIVMIILGFLLAFPVFAYAQTASPVVTTTPAPTLDLKLYVREGCVHCAKVKAFIAKYNLTDKVTIIETISNQANIDALNAWYTKFKIADAERGVPFFVINGTSFLQGDTPVIDYLTKTFNVTVTPDTTPTSSTDVVFVVVGGLVLFSILGYGIYTMIGKKK